MDLSFLFLYRKIEQTSAFSSKKYINWAAKNKTSDGRSIGRSIHDGPKKIQTGLWTSKTTSNTCQNFVPRFSVFRTLDIVWAF